MKKYKVTFIFVQMEEDPHEISPREMLERDKEDGGEFGFEIKNIKIKKIK